MQKGPTAAGRLADLKDEIWSLPEPESAGASTYVVVLETDAEGNCAYLPEPDRPRYFHLGRPFGSTRLAFIHTLRTVLLIDPTTNALRGLAAFFDGHLRTCLLGAMWGTWIDDRGHRHSESAPLEQLNSTKFFVRMNDSGDRIRIEFGVRADNIELFTPSVRRRIRQAGSEYRLALDYTIPSGRFLQAEILAVDPRTQTVTMTTPAEGFPIRWPRLATRSKMPPPQSAKPSRSSPTEDGHTPPRPAEARPAGSAPADPAPRPAAPPAGEERPSSGTYGFAGSGPSGSTSRGKESRTAGSDRGNPERPAGQNAKPGNSRARVAPRLRLKPRSGGASATPPPRAASSRPASSQPDEASPPPKSGTSYGFKPGQVSDPLGRKTPFNEAAGPRMGSGAPRGASTRRTPAPRASMRGPRDPGRPAPARPEPLPRTENLSTSELVEVIRKENDPERQWKLMEPNLMMGRAERTYSLIANFAELLSDRTPEWPAARLRIAFAHQPGAVLIGIMDRWHMNQVLPVAEANSESAKIMQWLREREVDRMLRLDLNAEITTAEGARKALRVDRVADEAMIRKTWRILLQFLNADHGRRDEKAIHRQKDEIAKYLQTARDYLLKVTFR